MLDFPWTAEPPFPNDTDEKAASIASLNAMMQRRVLRDPPKPT